MSIVSNAISKTSKKLTELIKPVKTLYIAAPLILGLSACSITTPIAYPSGYYDDIYGPYPSSQTIAVTKKSPKSLQRNNINSNLESKLDTLDKSVASEDYFNGYSSDAFLDNTFIFNDWSFNRFSPLRNSFRDFDGDGILDFADPMPYTYGPYVDMNNDGVIDWPDIRVSSYYGNNFGFYSPSFGFGWDTYGWNDWNTYGYWGLDFGFGWNSFGFGWNHYGNRYFGNYWDNDWNHNYGFNHFGNHGNYNDRGRYYGRRGDTSPSSRNSSAIRGNNANPGAASGNVSPNNRRPNTQITTPRSAESNRYIRPRNSNPGSNESNQYARPRTANPGSFYTSPNNNNIRKYNPQTNNNNNSTRPYTPTNPARRTPTYTNPSNNNSQRSYSNPQRSTPQNVAPQRSYSSPQRSTPQNVAPQRSYSSPSSGGGGNVIRSAPSIPQSAPQQNNSSGGSGRRR